MKKKKREKRRYLAPTVAFVPLYGPNYTGHPHSDGPGRFLTFIAIRKCFQNSSQTDGDGDIGF